MNIEEIKQKYIGRTVRIIKGYAEGIVGKVLYVYKQNSNIYLSVDAGSKLVFPRLDEVEIVKPKIEKRVREIEIDGEIWRFTNWQISFDNENDMEAL
jgi:hypothetical protein